MMNLKIMAIISKHAVFTPDTVLGWHSCILGTGWCESCHVLNACLLDSTQPHPTVYISYCMLVPAAVCRLCCAIAWCVIPLCSSVHVQVLLPKGSVACPQNWPLLMKLKQLATSPKSRCV